MGVCRYDSFEMRLAFFGSGEFGLPTLRHLAEHHELLAVVTQPDRPAGRGSRLTPTPVAAFAAERLASVALLKPERVGDAGVTREVRSLAGPGSGSGGADAWVVIAFGQKLPAGLLEGMFAINLHASLLPRWRGAAPINSAIMAQDALTGNSVITLAERMDAGLILAQSPRPLDPSLTAGDLHDRLAEEGPSIVSDVLARFAAGTLRPVAQDESRVTRSPKLSRADGWVDFASSAAACRARIHGLNPWPGVTVTVVDESVKLLRAEVVEVPAGSAGAQAGRVVDAAEGVVACGEGTALRLVQVQPAGKTAMSWKDYARGRVIPEDTLLTTRAPRC